ncbi:MAG: hypothetical protein ACUVQ1_05565 [Candidatus Kapaibacteriales bacterium]
MNKQARVKATKIMQPINKRVEEDETISQAIHKLLMWQYLCFLVTKSDGVVGILRISEIFNVIVSHFFYNVIVTIIFLSFIIFK